LWWIAADGPERNVCWFAGVPVLGRSKKYPWSGRIETPARGGSSGSAVGSTKERGSHVCSTRGPVTFAGERRCRTTGCERGWLPWQVATRLRWRRGSTCCGYKEKRCRKTGSASLRLRTAMVRVGSRDCGAVKLLSTQIVCSTRRKHFVSNEVANCLQGRRQRIPTVRTVAGLGNSEDAAKSANIRACASTGCCKCLWTVGIRIATLLKSGASRQEKASACNWNGAASDEHICDGVVFHRCADVDAAGSKHLDSLLDND
jgi:hypothetical protein